MRLPFVIFVLLAAFAANAQLLVKNVNVIDVLNKKLLPGYDVLVTDGKISYVGNNRKYKLPGGTEVIDGSGKWLVPGYTDAHVHFFQSGGIYARPDVIDLRKYRPFDQQLRFVHQNMEDFLRRYASCGITSVIDVGASQAFLRQRDTFSNKPYAPIVKMTGPLLTTYVPAAFKDLGEESPFDLMLSEEGVRKSVQQQLSLHADFIKIWYIVSGSDLEESARKSLPLVRAAIDEAHKNNLRVAVHAQERVTAQLAVEAGADFLVHSIKDEVITDEFAQLLRKNKTILCPTLVVLGNYYKVLGDYYHFSEDELQTANPYEIGTVLDYPLPDSNIAKAYMLSVGSPAARAATKKADSIQAVNLTKLVDAGVMIAAGTDAGNIGTHHGSSYFDELAAMQNAGMNSWQLLESATINGARVLGEENSWGSISEGRIANMLLLNEDPLASLANWRKIDRVILKGVAYRPGSFVENTPEMLVQQQLNSYNAHNLEAFLAPYADTVKIYAFPDRLLLSGKEAMRKDYQFVTRTPNLYCRVSNRMIMGNMVIDREEITGFGTKLVYGIAMYIIEGGKIARVYFRQ